jgi:hypothetical protein
MRLGWPDLLIELPPEEVGPLLEPWAWKVEGRVAPIFLNKFGAWFLLRPAGHVDMLDVCSGELSVAAESYEAFRSMVNEQDWQEQHLLSRVVFDLHQAGKVPAQGECYPIAPHPAFGGPNPARGDGVHPAQIMVMGLRVWHSICRQALGGPP